ncbi:unnamed protein product, partial [Closterium sp. NIES-53]
MISYLFSEEGTLTRKLFAYELKTGQQKLLVAPPGGGVDEDNLSMEEKLRRERQRERGLGITRYDWSKNVAVPRIMIPLPDGVSLLARSYRCHRSNLSRFFPYKPVSDSPLSLTLLPPPIPTPQPPYNPPNFP